MAGRPAGLRSHHGRMTDNTPAGDNPPRSYLGTPTGQPGGVAGKVQLRAGSAEAVLAVVPHMLGFYPNRSLVVLGLGDRNRVRVTFRYDLPDPPDAELAADIADHAAYVLTRERISSAMLIGYGPELFVNPVVGCVVDTLIVAGVRVPDALRADGGRYWSLFCDDPACCPPAGKCYDPGSHPAAAEMSSAGMTAHPDREALVRTLQPPAGSSEATQRAADLARLSRARVAALSQASGEQDPRLRLIRVGRAAVQRAIRPFAMTPGPGLALLAPGLIFGCGLTCSGQLPLTTFPRQPRCSRSLPGRRVTGHWLQSRSNVRSQPIRSTRWLC